MAELESIHELYEVRKQLQEHYNKFGETPTYKKFPEIYKRIINGTFSEFGIECWLDLLTYAGIFPKHKSKWKGYGGLERAKEEALSYFEKTGKVPRAHTPGFSRIASPIYNGYWREFNINSWTDFLTYCGLPHHKSPNNEEMRLMEAIHEFVTLEQKLGRIPSINEMPKLFNLINRGVWQNFGIFNWNDFVFWAKTSLYTGIR
ncbi:MAG: hypothetical protein D6732_03435 [Methanobacteriota archaeon]|nr:MAG: hypothetical protein D6732_03435 [Euryarchaeota archaeon]